MSYASKLGRARISPSNPSAAGICDRCGAVYSHCDLEWQFDYRGPVLQNLRILVCRRCLDTPQDQLRTIVLPADPMPIMQPRVQDYLTPATSYPVGQGPVGLPDNLDINAVMPLEGTTAYRVQLNPLSIIANSTDTITVTFSAPHGLATDDQIVVQGLTNPLAAGAYSVTVTSATAFTYTTLEAVPAGALLTTDTLMVTANIGLPRGSTQIPHATT
ncbi:MAG: hypothetical protein KGL39_50855 [Patescibacteria group bacterium]|nr:hypothetical protein [Patescibacteria group bacterium]